MTGQQKAWLDANPTYRVVGQAAGGFHFARQTFLLPDGTTRQPPRKADDQPIPEGSFHVGVLTPNPGRG